MDSTVVEIGLAGPLGAAAGEARSRDPCFSVSLESRSGGRSCGFWGSNPMLLTLWQSPHHEYDACHAEAALRGQQRQPVVPGEEMVTGIFAQQGPMSKRGGKKKQYGEVHKLYKELFLSRVS